MHVQVPPEKTCRIWAISDIHVDHESNLSWLKKQQPARSSRCFDVCIVPGDVSDDITLLSKALRELRCRFDEVVFTVGNHDLWVKRQRQKRFSRHETSVDKLRAVLNLCTLQGVRCGPLWLHEQPGSGGSSLPSGGLLIAPLLSWHHASWDTEPELPGAPIDSSDSIQACGDSLFCRWPKGLLDGEEALLARWFAELNEPSLQELMAALPAAAEFGRSPPQRVLTEAETLAMYDQIDPQPHFLSGLDCRISQFATRRANGQGTASEGILVDMGFEPQAADERRPFVISFSHFCPKLELLPEKRLYDSPVKACIVPKISGSVYLERQIRRLQPDLHLFGHTHVPVDMTIDGIRYVQWPLGNPTEQDSATRLQAGGGFMCLFDGLSADGEAPEHWTMLGAHYRDFERDLERTQLAPYMRRRLPRRLG